MSIPRTSIAAPQKLPRLVATAALVAIALFATAGSATAAPSDLDPSFNGTGYTLTSVSPSSGANAVIVQPNSKLIAVGAGLDAYGNQNSFALARYNADGTLDSSFGSGGEVTTTFPSFTAGSGNAAVLQPDGKIIVAGMASSYSTGDVFALARYNSDGTLDASFGSGGLVATPLSTFTYGGAQAVALQGDGKIVVAGTVDQGGQVFGVARYNSDGSLDTTFGVDGLAIAPFYYWEQAAASGVAVQPDGKIVVAGTGAALVTLARFNSDGTLDSSFGSGGEAQPAYGYAYSIALQGDGKIVTAGRDLNGFLMVARSNTDGTPDNGFGNGGEATINLSPTAVYAAANAVQIQNNGKIVAAGSASGNSSYFAVARFNPDGTTDGTFGNGGAVLTSLPPAIGLFGGGLALQTDGRIVVAGRAVVETGDGQASQFAVARYQGGEETPAQLLAALGNAVVGVGPGTSLADKITQASTSLARNHIRDTCSTLTAFISQVNAGQKGKTISGAEAATLIADAKQIMTLLSC
jgi:uncharacterized delta-60 repeat protein